MSKSLDNFADVLRSLDLTPDQIEAVQAAAKATIKPQSGGKITPKVSANKGVLSVYGLNVRTPVNLYAPQWVRFLDWLAPGVSTPLHSFIAENISELSFRSEDEREATFAAVAAIIGD